VSDLQMPMKGDTLRCISEPQEVFDYFLTPKSNARAASTKKEKGN